MMEGQQWRKWRSVENGGGLEGACGEGEAEEGSEGAGGTVERSEGVEGEGSSG